jgi:hypothetical protein
MTNPRSSYERAASRKVETTFEEGQRIFRFDTFGDEDFWGGQLGLHKPIAGEKHGGTGPGLTPQNALDAGLKVDVAKLPAPVVELLQTARVDLGDPEQTFMLLQHDAVVGVKGFFDQERKTLTSIGITCGFCHSTVDDSMAPGIGRRLDGWPNRDLNVGAIVLLAPNLKPIVDALGVGEATVKNVLSRGGPGKYDAELNIDGKAFRPDGKSGATLIPPAFGMAGINNHTWTGSWGNVTYWNAYVANTQMHGKGTFFDSRLLDAAKFPLAVKNHLGDLHAEPDLITPKLAALNAYQLALPPPRPAQGSFDADAAGRGRLVFAGKAQCSSCHVPPIFTEPGYNLHPPGDIGIDDFQSSRSPDGKYRTAPLRGLFTHTKGGFYHDGRFPKLEDVVNHYDGFKKLALDDAEKRDLVEYLKSL